MDPQIRPGMRFYENSKIDDRTNCGAIVVLVTAHTGESGVVAAASEIRGKPLSSRTRGDTSVVTVEIHYRSRTVGVPAPPARATINVLAVRRGSSWFVATPDAFNPQAALRGGLSEAELRREHEQLLAAATP